MRALATLLIGFVLVGCTPAVKPEASPGASAERDGGITASDVVALRTYTGLYQRESQRTLNLPPEVTIFADGTVVADVSPFDPENGSDYRSIALDDDRLSDILHLLADGGCEPIPLPRDSHPFAGGGAVVFQLRDNGGRWIEIVVSGLAADTPGVDTSVFDRNLVALDRLMNKLRDEASRDGQPWQGALPLVPVMPNRSI